MLLSQMIKKNRDPRWGEEFEFMLEEPPTDDRLHVEVISASSRIGLLHPKVGTMLLLRPHAISIMIKYMISCKYSSNDTSFLSMLHII